MDLLIMFPALAFVKGEMKYLLARNRVTKPALQILEMSVHLKRNDSF